MPKILIIEDDKELNCFLQDYLANNKYKTVSTYTGEEGLQAWQREKPDLILLDLNLLGMDGLDLTREVRRVDNTPIIMVTARADEVDRLIGLEIGADDYITKPFSPREVIARIKAVLRRSKRSEETQSLITLGPLVIDPTMYAVRINNRNLDLTPTEFDILSQLASQPGRVFTRLQLLNASEDIPCKGNERTVDVHIKNLRQKLKSLDPDTSYVETVFGVGYRSARFDD
jgi:DNA-binding response OmpR family regulator